MRIKLTPLDRLFARYIKLRDKVCQRCGGTGGLQTSHFWGRAKKSVRWDEENACLLCMGCHMYLTAHPYEHTEFFKKRIGERAFDLLMARTKPQKPDIQALTIYLGNKIKELENGS